MKSGYCEQCPKRHACALEYNTKSGEMEVICRRMKAELWRVEKPKRKGRIEIVYASELDGPGANKFQNCVWGTVKEE